MTVEIFPFDAAPYLANPQSQAELIADALESGNASYIAAALGVVARARGMAAVARQAGVTRRGYALRSFQYAINAAGFCQVFGIIFRVVVNHNYFNRPAGNIMA